MPVTVDINRIGHRREFCWKNLVRFFITPVQKRHQGGGTACWRLCGTDDAGHFHVFWDCWVIKGYWEEIHKHLENAFDVKISFKCESLYLGGILMENLSRKNKKLLSVLLAASKKGVTRKWLSVESPTIDEWIDIVHEIYVMEKLSFSRRVQKEKFYQMWTKWTEYVKHVRPDFV